MEAQKRAAGEAGAALVEPGMTVGLGSGSTAVFLVRALAARRLAIRAVATSEAIAALAREEGMAVVDLDAAGAIDLTIDGADEIAPDLSVIKGAGGALLREKLVWLASKRRVVIADASKPRPRLGRFPLPVEVVAFGHRTTAGRIAAALQEAGLGAKPVLRGGAAAPYVTDGGNVIYDVVCGEIDEPADLAVRLKAITGVVEHGLFVGLADAALIGEAAGVRRLAPA